jgi:hypothetical protein
MVRCARGWPAILLAFTAAACGSGSPSAPAASPTPAPTPNPIRTVLVSRGFTLAAGATFSDTVDNVPAGLVDVRADWPGASDLNLYATDTSCPGVVELVGGRCRVFAQAVGTARPERIEFTTAAPGNYVYWVRSLGPSSEAVTLEVGVTR